MHQPLPQHSEVGKLFSRVPALRKQAQAVAKHVNVRRHMRQQHADPVAHARPRCRCAPPPVRPAARGRPRRRRAPRHGPLPPTACAAVRVCRPPGRCAAARVGRRPRRPGGLGPSLRSALLTLPYTRARAAAGRGGGAAAAAHDAGAGRVAHAARAALRAQPRRAPRAAEHGAAGVPGHRAVADAARVAARAPPAPRPALLWSRCCPPGPLCAAAPVRARRAELWELSHRLQLV